MDDLTFELYKLAAVTIGFIVGIFMIPAIKTMVANIQDDQLRRFIRNAVLFAQQTMTSDVGLIKYNKVRDLVTEWLNARGMKITEEQLKLLIESAVYSMKHGLPE